ncbi:MAG: polysaccharide biosynthesis/export family protein [Bacteroidota bacterium]|nr:polysaccharide biosynthesis/export family protein [Bacteroidota bacterium]
MKRYFVLFCFLIGGFASAQVLNPGDGVRIMFYNIPEKITGDYFLQNDSTVQLPYIGSIVTANRTYESIKNEIFKKYDSLYKDPELTIQPLYKINILGEIKTPGYYYITGYEKLAGIFAMAGGETSDADVENTYIIRDNKEIKLGKGGTIANGNTIGEYGLESGDRIFVPHKWWVGARNTAVIISGAAVLVTLVGILLKK